MVQLLRVAWILSALMSLAFLIVIPGWYFWLYTIEPDNPYRLEYLEAVGISILLLAPVSLIVFLVLRVLLRKYRT